MLQRVTGVEMEQAPVNDAVTTALEGKFCRATA